MSTFIRNLLDRKIGQWALAYVAGAWLVLQVIDVLAGAWSLSVPLQRGIQIFLASGLLVTLVLAWYHGERGRQRVSGPELLVISALLAIAGGLTAVLARGGDSASETAGDDARAGEVAEVGARPAGLPSIAVLPFADLSPAGDQSYFADGVAEEILNALARLPGLKVAARTSAFSFRGTSADIPTIGARLGVDNVLEGSVRMDGDQVRITAQLISVDDGFHLWSAEYDRELEGIFAIQEEIAAEITSALEVRLGGGASEGAWVSRTRPDAYQAFLRGRQAFHELTSEGFATALAQYSRAAGIDSTFAPARSGVAATHFAMWYFGVQRADSMIPRAKREAREALALEDDLAEPHAVLALIALYHDWDWGTAEREARRALELDPNQALARHAYGDLLTVLGQPEAGLRQVEMGREADPLSFLASGPAVAHLAFVGRYEEMIDGLGTLRELFPRNETTSFLALGLWYLGRFDEAVDEYRKTWVRDPDLSARIEAAIASGGPRAGMRAWADALAERHGSGTGALEVAYLYGRSGATEEALRWLDIAVEERDPSLVHIAVHPDFAALRADPRFDALLERIGIPRTDDRGATRDR